MLVCDRLLPSLQISSGIAADAYVRVAGRLRLYVHRPAAPVAAVIHSFLVLLCFYLVIAVVYTCILFWDRIGRERNAYISVYLHMTVCQLGDMGLGLVLPNRKPNLRADGY